MKSHILTDFRVYEVLYLTDKNIIEQTITSHNNKVILMNEKVFTFRKVGIVTLIFLSGQLIWKIETMLLLLKLIN